ncbi:beta-ketoacyl-[acyl-carrier-protein] synthase family protein [Actinomadura macrotermitis]|uniref:3-oxoacyl-[acyl-carrier-protein] synthase 2 n=1 Tax=Actinomadura macrotermitis TaxID=2585200 RepID=A0A7K0C502_9ACTN|nr:beta-ketoacyl-[acyl-carrier-protein] synthase family protein [Actinomadura macrotermitis]MQY07904.1 3-oxoacyl-[acyl-carrier-protein] synthase 2 [Actinomadura macrotermitis]
MPASPALTTPGPHARRRRVVVTGLGVLSGIGTGAAGFAAALRAGRSAARPLTAFDTTGYAHATGCPVTGFEPDRRLRRVPPGDLGRAAQFAAAAGRMAAADAGLAEADLRAVRCQVSIGTTDGGSHELDGLTAAELAGGPAGLDPAAVRRVPAPGLSAAVARELGLTDVEATTIGTACSAGNHAIGDGLDAIRSGDADIALCGGADAVCRKTFTAFYRLGTVAPDQCRPFDAGRRGILPGEGAGVLVLESRDAALARGARVYAEVLGYGLNCDARHPVAPDQDGVARCMELALHDAGVAPGDVDLISAHGTGTKANDVTEARAIRAVYGPEPPRTVGLKSMLGHTMGAASALAAAACALAITHRFVPPTINHRGTDPACEIDCVPNTAVEADLRVVQNNGMAFGGNNAVVLFGRHEAAS